MRFSTRLLPVLLFLAFVPRPVGAKQLKITDATSSSSYAEEKGRTYDAKNVKDAKLSTAWFEGVDGGGLGSWIQLELGEPQTVSGIRIWNGDWITADLWKRENRMQDIDIETSDGTKYPFKLKDEMVAETLTFPTAVTTSSVKIRFKSIYRGSTFNDTGVSEIQVLDATPSRTVPVAGYSASTTYPADSDGSYIAENLGDGMIDSLWCEAAKTDGSGEWLQFTFASAHALQGMTIRNGNTTNLQLFMDGSHAAAVTLTFSDGTTQQIPLKSSINDQLIPLGGKSTSSVKLTVNGVAKGSDPGNTDLCFSEVSFTE
jgi:hypothetical protein